MFRPPEIKALCVCPVFCLSVFVDVSSPGSKHTDSLHLRLKCSRGNFPVDYVAVLWRNGNFITSTIKPPGEKDSRRLLRVTSRCFRKDLGSTGGGRGRTPGLLGAPGSSTDPHGKAESRNRKLALIGLRGQGSLNRRRLQMAGQTVTG